MGRREGGGGRKYRISVDTSRLVSFFSKVEEKRRSLEESKHASPATSIDVTVHRVKNTGQRSVGTFFKGTNVVKYEMTLKITKERLLQPFPFSEDFPIALASDDTLFLLLRK